MAEAKTQCAACGADILVSTAERTGGRCRACESGTRGQIDAGRRQAQQDKAFHASPVWQFWLRLVASDFTTLRPPERVYFAVNEMRGSVLNGGFQSYFSAFAERSLAAEEGLKTLNGLRTLELLRAARKLLTGGNPDGIVESSKLTEPLDNPEVDRQLDLLNQQFYVDADRLWDKLQDFGVRQGFFAEAWPTNRNSVSAR